VRQEWRDGVGGVTAPIRDSSARVVAAVRLSGPSDRLKPLALREHAQLVVEAAEGISREFGFRGLEAPTTGPRSG
jgi:DNA-binding IclR family transcriptional regulator